MYSCYGPQHWWPVSFTRKKEEKKKLAAWQMEIMLGAILTQNTSWKNVESALGNLAQADLLNLDRLLQTPQARIARLIRPARYFNQKAQYLKEFLSYLKAYPHLNALSLKDLRESLLACKGIGLETADSMLLYAFGRPIFVIDTYTKRIFSRFGLIEKKAKYQEVQNFVHQRFKIKGKERTAFFNEFHALIVRHAVECCQTKPRCEKCVLGKCCFFNAKIKNQKPK